MEKLREDDPEIFGEEVAAIEDEVMQNSALLASLTAPHYAAGLLRRLADQIDALSETAH